MYKNPNYEQKNKKTTFPPNKVTQIAFAFTINNKDNSTLDNNRSHRITVTTVMMMLVVFPAAAARPYFRCDLQERERERDFFQ